LLLYPLFTPLAYSFQSLDDKEGGSALTQWSVSLIVDITLLRIYSLFRDTAHL